MNKLSQHLYNRIVNILCGHRDTSIYSKYYESKEVYEWDKSGGDNLYHIDAYQIYVCNNCGKKFVRKVFHKVSMSYTNHINLIKELERTGYSNLTESDKLM